MKVFAIIVLFFVVTSSPQGIKSKYLLIRLRENARNPRKSNHPQAIGRSLFRSDKSGEQGAIDWTGPLPKIWTNSQCRNLGNYEYNLENCKRTCLEKSGCNAISANPGGCTLRGCPWPVPGPSHNYENYEGFYLTKEAHRILVKADYKFIGGCEKGVECSEGFVCGDTDNYPVCRHCSFDECKEHAMKNQTYAFAYKIGNTDMKKGWCKLCNDKEFSKFEKGTDEGHKGWGLYAKKENGIKENRPCGDAHKCHCGLKCEDKKENGYGTCKRNWSDDNCYWKGDSPVCSPADCGSDSMQVLRNRYGDGAMCWTGTKRWCCRNC